MELVQEPDNTYYLIDRTTTRMSNEAFTDVCEAVRGYNEGIYFNYATNSQPTGRYSVNYPYVYDAKGDLDGTIICEFETLDDIKEQLPELFI